MLKCWNERSFVRSFVCWVRDSQWVSWLTVGIRISGFRNNSHTTLWNPWTPNYFTMTPCITATPFLATSLRLGPHSVIPIINWQRPKLQSSQNSKTPKSSTTAKQRNREIAKECSKRGILSRQLTQSAQLTELSDWLWVTGSERVTDWLTDSLSWADFRNFPHTHSLTHSLTHSPTRLTFWVLTFWQNKSGRSEE